MNLRVAAIVLAVALCGSVISTPGDTGTVTLPFRTPWAEYTLTFDPNVISVDEVRKLVRISPYDFYACSKPDLEYCVTGSCDFGLTTGWRSSNYFKNAEINIEKSKEQLAFLENLTYPAELRPWVQYLQRFWSFSSWLEETRLDFYKTWDVETLKRKYQDLDPAESCSVPIRSIQAADGDHNTQYMLAKFQWGTCLTEKYQPVIGIYSTEPWENFRANFHITEKVKLPEEDDD